LAFDDNARMNKKANDKRKRSRWPGLVIGVVLVSAAVGTELRKPAADRTWEGRLAGFVPYDLRPPTPSRVRQRLWNASEPRLFVPTVFGVGWTVNIRRLVGLVLEAAHRGCRPGQAVAGAADSFSA
jgi:Family of unknown function (DUF5808)